MPMKIFFQFETGIFVRGQKKYTKHSLLFSSGIDYFYNILGIDLHRFDWM